MDPSECSVFSPSEVLTFSVDMYRNILISLVNFKAESNDTVIWMKHTLQAAGVVFNEELGLWFCQQGGHTVHDLYPTLRCTVWIWNVKRLQPHPHNIGADNMQWAEDGDHTLLGDKLRGYSDFKCGEQWWVVTRHDVISATCKLESLAESVCLMSLKGRFFAIKSGDWRETH